MRVWNRQLVIPVALTSLQKQQRRTTAWRPVRTLTASSTGAASYRFANGLSGYYRWVPAPGAGTPVRVGRAVALTATARVVAKAPSGRIVLYARTTAHTRLHVRPAVSYAGSLSFAHATKVR